MLPVFEVKKEMSAWKPTARIAEKWQSSEPYLRGANLRVAPSRKCRIPFKKWLKAAFVLGAYVAFGMQNGLASSSSSVTLGKVHTVVSFDARLSEIPEGLAIRKQGNICAALIELFPMDAGLHSLPQSGNAFQPARNRIHLASARVLDFLSDGDI
jgi:hypothetical protein